MTTRTSSSVRWALVLTLAAVTFIGYSFYEKKARLAEGEAPTWTRLITALSDTNTGVIEVRSGETKVSWASAEAMRIFGYNDTMIGSDITELMGDGVVPVEHNNRVLFAMEKVRSGEINRRVTAITCVGKKRNGEEVKLVIRIFLGRQSVIALLNLAEETRYLPLVPLEVPEPLPPKK